MLSYIKLFTCMSGNCIQSFLSGLNKVRTVTQGTKWKAISSTLISVLCSILLLVWWFIAINTVNAELIEIIYDWIGCAAFCIGSCLSDFTQGKKRTTAFVCSLLTSFGGGAILRDISTLHRLPAILGSPGQIIFVCLLSIIFQYGYNKFTSLKHSINDGNGKYWLIAADSVGVLVFIKIGIEHAITLEKGIFILFFCGFFTAVGGGFCASTLRALIEGVTSTQGMRLHVFFNSLKNSVIKNAKYYMYVGTISSMYISIILAGISTETAIAILTPVALIGGFLIDSISRKKLVSRFCSIMSIKRIPIKYYNSRYIILLSDNNRTNFTHEGLLNKKHLAALERRISAMLLLYLRNILCFYTAYHRRLGWLA